MLMYKHHYTQDGFCWLLNNGYGYGTKRVPGGCSLNGGAWPSRLFKEYIYIYINLTLCSDPP